jgi:hypothetical protein
MKLRPLSLADEAQALQGHSELATESWEYLLGYAESLPWAEYVEALHDESLGRNLKEGRVPATFLMAESEGILIGRASIRHELNDFLFNLINPKLFIFHVIESFSYILKSLIGLNKNNICFFNLSPQNIVFNLENMFVHVFLIWKIYVFSEEKIVFQMETLFLKWKIFSKVFETLGTFVYFGAILYA